MSTQKYLSMFFCCNIYFRFSFLPGRYTLKSFKLQSLEETVFSLLIANESGNYDPATTRTFSKVILLLSEIRVTFYENN